MKISKLGTFIAVMCLVAGSNVALASADESQHPSGKDRTEEPGQSGSQGSSPSDPDDDGRGPDHTNGGADKPGGPGGTDRSDQDGNNGCGNDQDFEDDNEGLCGGRSVEPPRTTTTDKPHKTTTTTELTPPPTNREGPPTTVTGPPPGDGPVPFVPHSVDEPRPVDLPPEIVRTGASSSTLGAIGAGLVLAGLVLAIGSRKRVGI